MVASAAAARQPLAYLSRGIAGVAASGTVILNAPGSPVAVREHLQFSLPLLAHSVAAAASLLAAMAPPAAAATQEKGRR